jgi:hypothetical protein
MLSRGIARDVLQSGTECICELDQSASHPVAENIPATVRSVGRSDGYTSPLNPLLAPKLTLVNYIMTNIGKTAHGLHGACPILLPPGWAVAVRCGNGIWARDTAQAGLFAISHREHDGYRPNLDGDN